MATREEKFEKQMVEWISFYRANIHRFAEHYLGLNLYFYQKVLLYMMNINIMFVLVAARGTAKSYMIAIYACCRCILYPRTKIVIVSGTLTQASLILTSKINSELRTMSPILDKEILSFSGTAGKEKLTFKNGSFIEVAPAGESGRGRRAHIIVLEEYRIIKKEVVDQVVVPFLAGRRNPPYTSKPEYAHLLNSEPNKQLYISSAGYKSEWMWAQINKVARVAVNQDKPDYGLYCLDYKVPFIEGGFTKEDKQAQMDTVDEFTQQMEFENKMLGRIDGAFFDFESLNAARKIKQAFYPENRELINKDKMSKKVRGEKRILSVDVALMATTKGSQNDNTVITGMKLIPDKNGTYRRQTVFIVTLSGLQVEDQALAIKRIFDDFDANKVALDAGGVGQGLYDVLTSSQYDPERATNHPSWVAYNNDNMRINRGNKDSLPIIYSIKPSAESNSEMIYALRHSIKEGMLELPEPEGDAETYISKTFKVYKESDPALFSTYIAPYRQTSALVNEMVNLTSEVNGNRIKVKEAANARKDRFSSLMYANWLAKVMEIDDFKTSNISFDDSEDYVFWK